VIAGIDGTIVAKTGDRVVIATPGGVQYEVAVPLGVLERLPDEGRPVQLQTVPIVREDQWALYGFDRPHERKVFQRLLSATGVGPRLALAMVSTLGGTRVARALKDADLAVLCAVPGIGKKTAERLVVELKDKMGDVTPAEAVGGTSDTTEQAVQALVNLGYNRSDADKAVRLRLSEDGAQKTVDLIRGALQLLTKGK
jgi:Holliday junction DNA helicase RuvA